METKFDYFLFIFVLSSLNMIYEIRKTQLVYIDGINRWKCKLKFILICGKLSKILHIWSSCNQGIFVVSGSIMVRRVVSSLQQAKDLASVK